MRDGCPHGRSGVFSALGEDTDQSDGDGVSSSFLRKELAMLAGS